jgi:predicted alpha-1,2-mannosidase
MKVLYYLVLTILCFSSCTHNDDKLISEQSTNQINDYTDYVDPFIGTDKMGHTFPGATVPFGMVQLSPETNLPNLFIDGEYNKDSYKYCAGYQYADSTIFGFSHTHMSGTGHSDLGDFLILPTLDALNLEENSGVTKNNNYSTYTHESETASPGYYSVLLDKHNIQAELTTTERVGFHQYTFNTASDSAQILLDLTSNIYNHKDKNVWTFIRVENDSVITGYRQTNGWARTRIVYFAMKFSKSFHSYGHKKYDNSEYNGFYRKFDEEKNFPEMAGKKLKAYFTFAAKTNEKIKIKFALSSVSTNGALNNMESEINNWDFEEVKQNSHEKWKKELSKIEIESINENQKTSFYTSLYHTMLSPNIYEDVDGQYRGLDQNIHQSDDFTNYTTFSLWDTYRALHPLYSIIQVRRNNDMIKSMLAHQKQSVHNMLPIWSHSSNENWCMIGYHSVSVIADAIVKNNSNFNNQEALLACIETSNCRYFDGIGHYIDYKYIPEDKEGNSVSKTLEYAYDDWTISQIAKYINDTLNAKKYLLKSEGYNYLYDSISGFMRPKLSNGKWKSNFDPLNTHGQGFIEGNAWNYGLYVPQNIDAMIKMMGGKSNFVIHLDSLFTMTLDSKYYAKHEDITKDGIMGSYVHGNEPGHHIPYLYNWTNQPWKTQKRVRLILNEMYDNKVDGLCGNDDAGQMSAWYIFSSLGFYPVTPGSTDYALGSPLVVSAKINLENGNTINISTVNQSSENIYVSKVELNGVVIDTRFINHLDLVNNGELVFYMSNTPQLK